MKEKTKKIDPIKKAKRKKAWLVFLRVVLITAAIIAILKITDVLVEKTINNAFISEFEFSDNDKSVCVTTDFKVPLKMKSKNGKYHKVKWTEKSPYISIDKEGNVKVKTPTGKNVKVVLWENYGWFIFKGKRQYVVTLITSDVQQYASEADIPVAKILNSTYNRRMDAVVDENNNIVFLIGDFGNVKIYNEKDALAYIEHNRESLNIPNELEIRPNNSLISNLLSRYDFDVFYDGIRVDDNTISIAVSNEDFKPIKVISDVSRELSSNINENVEIDMDECKEFLEERYDSQLTINKIETVISDNKYCSILSISSDYSDESEICVCNDTLDIIFEKRAAFATDSVISYGVTEKGIEVEFNNSYDEGIYYMYDKDRNIKTFQGYEHSECLKDETSIGSLKEIIGDSQAISPYISDPTQIVFSKKKNYDDSLGVEVEAFKYTQDAYDYYKDTFNWISYDNKKSPIEIHTNAEGDDVINNAMWEFDHLLVGKTDKYNTSIAADPAIIYHEYSHGVFGTMITERFSCNENDKEIQALNEAFADVMGLCLLEDDSWCIGKVDKNVGGEVENVCLRNLTYGVSNSNINTPNKCETNSGDVPKDYDDFLLKCKNQCDQHDLSIFISNIAYEMCNSGYFTQSDVALVWFYAMHEGYTNNLTLPEFRVNIINAIEFIYANKDVKKKIEITEQIFNDKGISNDWDNPPSKNNPYRIISNYNNSVEGDPILDDSKMNSYYMFYSPIAFTSPKPKVFIFESTSSDVIKEGKSSKDNGSDIETYINSESQLKKDHEELLEAKQELDQVMAALKELFSNSDGNDSSTTQEKSEIQVVYMRVPKVVMNSIQAFNKQSEIQVKENLLDAFTEDEDSSFWQKIVDVIWRLLFHDEYYESTAYDFYTSL